MPAALLMAWMPETCNGTYPSYTNVPGADMQQYDNKIQLELFANVQYHILKSSYEYHVSHGPCSYRSYFYNISAHFQPDKSQKLPVAEGETFEPKVHRPLNPMA